MGELSTLHRYGWGEAGAAGGSDLLGEDVAGAGGGDEGLGMNFVNKKQPITTPIVMVYRNLISMPTTENIIYLVYSLSVVKSYIGKILKNNNYMKNLLMLIPASL